ncbi:MAG: hypothetical protein ABWY00_11170 [Dongiaceae bacterium]
MSINAALLPMMGANPALLPLAVNMSSIGKEKGRPKSRAHASSEVGANSSFESGSGAELRGYPVDPVATVALYDQAISGINAILKGYAAEIHAEKTGRQKQHEAALAGLRDESGKIALTPEARIPFWRRLFGLGPKASYIYEVRELTRQATAQRAMLMELCTTHDSIAEYYQKRISDLREKRAIASLVHGPLQLGADDLILLYSIKDGSMVAACAKHIREAYGKAEPSA